MKITKCVPRFDPATNDLVLEHLEMEQVHDGVLHLRPAFLERLLKLVPAKTLTLDEMIPEDLDENQVNTQVNEQVAIWEIKRLLNVAAEKEAQGNMGNKEEKNDKRNIPHKKQD